MAKTTERLRHEHSPFESAIKQFTDNAPEGSLTTMRLVEAYVDQRLGEAGTFDVVEEMVTPHKKRLMLGTLLRVCGWVKTRRMVNRTREAHWQLIIRHSLGIGWLCYTGENPCMWCTGDKRSWRGER